MKDFTVSSNDNRSIHLQWIQLEAEISDRDRKLWRRPNKTKLSDPHISLLYIEYLRYTQKYMKCLFNNFKDARQHPDAPRTSQEVVERTLAALLLSGLA